MRFFFAISLLSIVNCDITNVDELVNVLKSNSSTSHTIGYLTSSNMKLIKRYTTIDTKTIQFQSKNELLQSIDNGTILAGVESGSKIQDLKTRYHIFSTLMVSPQAMLLAPKYDPISSPCGFSNRENDDLFRALNAAIMAMQMAGEDETIFNKYNLSNIVRAYSCRSDTPLPVVNRNQTKGFLADILNNKTKLRIGGIGPFDWGSIDGNYRNSTATGVYPDLLEKIIEKMRNLKGSDSVVYGDAIQYERVFFPNDSMLYSALMAGRIHATDVYFMIDTTYQEQGSMCSSNETVDQPGVTCVNQTCNYAEVPRSLFFRTTCTVAARDSEFITKKSSDQSVTINPSETTTNSNRQTPKTRWIGFLLVFIVLFGSMFLILLIFVRGKKQYRSAHTITGGFGKFARLQEESEPPMDAIDSFDDQIVQSPENTTNSTR